MGSGVSSVRLKRCGKLFCGDRGTHTLEEVFGTFHEVHVVSHEFTAFFHAFHFFPEFQVFFFVSCAFFSSDFKFCS